MVKCSVIGCGKEAVFHAQHPIFGGVMYAKVNSCSKEHYDEIVKGLEDA